VRPSNESGEHEFVRGCGRHNHGDAAIGDGQIEGEERAATGLLRSETRGTRGDIRFGSKLEPKLVW
jgi:hypothetical protein